MPSARPVASEHPGTLAELVATVKAATAAGHRLKVVGAGYSRDAMASTDGIEIVLDRYRRLLRVDRASRQVHVQAGIRLAELARVLAGWGLALDDVGGTPGQTVGGAISTGSHGRGARSAGLAGSVTGLELVTADGSVVACSPAEEPDVFDAARVSLGALGVISSVTLQCGPGFNLRSATGTVGFEAMLERLDADDFTELMWFAPTGVAVVRSRNRTDDPAGRVGSGRVDRGYRVAPWPRHLPEPAIEYSVPRPAAGPTLQRVRELAAAHRRALPFPIRVVAAAADTLPMSAATGRPSVFIGVSRRSVEPLLDEAGRPQWGPLTDHTAAILRPRYPRWDAWQAVRRRLDPDRRFANPWTDRVLG